MNDLQVFKGYKIFVLDVFQCHKFEKKKRHSGAVKRLLKQRLSPSTYFTYYSVPYHVSKCAFPKTNTG